MDLLNTTAAKKHQREEKLKMHVQQSKDKQLDLTKIQVAVQPNQ